MLAEIYLLKLEAAVRAAKEAATTASTRGLCRSPYRLPRRLNPAFHRALAICPPQLGAPLGFRTIQACPKDLRVLPGHPEPAVSWHSGFRGGAHARPKATPVHHAARRRGSRVAARGACGAWPLAGRAQQAMPVIGYLNFGSPESDAPRLTGLRRGLSQTGYVEGRNLVIEYRWAGNQADRLPALAADLVQLRVAAIVSPGLVGTLAAKAATTSIPIVFNVGVDPVQLGLVASLNQPGGNLTGFNNVAGELGAKALALLHELVPGAETIGFLENPNNSGSELTTRDLLAAAPAVGLKVQILKARNDREIDAAFVSLTQARTGALLVANDLFFNNRIE